MHAVTVDAAEHSVVERDALLTALRSLPKGQRAVVVLRYFDDLSVEATAEALGCSAGNPNPASFQPVKRGNWAGNQYTCLRRRCASVSQELLDEYVERVVVAWLSREDIYEVLTAQAGTDADVAHARAEAQRLRAELEDWRRPAEAGDVTAISFAWAEKGLLAQTRIRG